jgi:hypothetical protein
MILQKKEINEFIESVYDSSNLYKSIYNTKKNELFIFFKRGGVYVYGPVSNELFEGLQNAESQGKYFHAVLKKSNEINYSKAFTLHEEEKNDLENLIESLRVSQNID